MSTNKTRYEFLQHVAAVVASGALALTLGACNSSNTPEPAAEGSGSEAAATATTDTDNKIIVGASPAPHAEILEAIKDDLAEAGYELEIVEYSDYVLPNVALSEGDLDANYFQHQPYLDDYNAENGTDLVGAKKIHFEPMAVYSNKYASLDEIPDGAKIAVPSDATNEARALLLLEAQGVITISEGAGLAATANDIVDNPHNIEIVETEAAQIPRALDDVDFGVVNGNYALSAGLDTSAIIAAESADSEAAETFGNVIAVRAGEENSAKTQALIDALTSEATREFIASTYDGVVVAVF